LTFLISSFIRILLKTLIQEAWCESTKVLVRFGSGFGDSNPDYHNQKKKNKLLGLGKCAAQHWEYMDSIVVSFLNDCQIKYDKTLAIPHYQTTFQNMLESPRVQLLSGSIQE
jgi:hypothetical protein